jgi:lipopolysaccharide/colanic/teichoic acid biosynthesis glycosyltransferase
VVRKSRLSGRLGLSGQFQRRGMLHSIHSVDRFRAILRNEQDRASRSEHEFSLLLFDIDGGRTGSGQLRDLKDALTGRIRAIDEVGWLDGKHLGVMLPYTSAVGAQMLAVDIYQALSTTPDTLEWAVYTYPSKWFADDDGDPRQYYFRDILPEWGTEESPDSCASVEDVAGGACASNAGGRLVQAGGNGELLAQTSRPLRHRPLPTWKRAMDIVGAAGGLILTSPFLLIMSLVIKIVSRGPVFFKQQRIGYMGKPFTMWKFRTMRVGADTSNHRQHVTRLINGCGQNGEGFGKPMIKLDDDPQIIPFGRILRKTCLDELPQLVNVLRGHMSLVGPRPAIAYEVEAYASWHHRRLDTVPGVTGLWQVNGKNRLTFNEMVRLDIEYLKERSFWLDIGILLKTPLAVLSQFKDSLREKRPMNELAVEKCLASE